ncbi:MAG TPA: 2,3-bisphosphoglycerate-dependent phosphoglycerate mutase [Steroidobacteraceae bacterium]|nr:2,3-bisphosphoglycerate-dependent phosphoglycerate mutase [Steroidobacteraceae bacterium]
MWPEPARLVLVRHGESHGNHQNIFTGWRDLDLTARGKGEAWAVGTRLAATGIVFGAAFTSALKRARDSASIILERLGQDVKIYSSAALNERNYGELTGLDKAEAATRFGAEQVRLWRRSFERRPPGGESLKDTVDRVVPFYCAQILPHLGAGESTLIVAHGNSLRALVMNIEHLSPSKIEKLEFRTGEIRIYPRQSGHATLE